MYICSRVRACVCVNKRKYKLAKFFYSPLNTHARNKYSVDFWSFLCFVWFFSLLHLLLLLLFFSISLALSLSCLPSKNKWRATRCWRQGRQTLVVACHHTRTAHIFFYFCAPAINFPLAIRSESCGTRRKNVYRTDGDGQQVWNFLAKTHFVHCCWPVSYVTIHKYTVYISKSIYMEHRPAANNRRGGEANEKEERKKSENSIDERCMRWTLNRKTRRDRAFSSILTASQSSSGCVWLVASSNAFGVQMRCAPLFNCSGKVETKWPQVLCAQLTHRF